MNESTQLRTSLNSYRDIWNHHKIDDVFTFINGKVVKNPGQYRGPEQLAELLCFRDGKYHNPEI